MSVSTLNVKNVLNQNGSGTLREWAYTFEVLSTDDIKIYTISPLDVITEITANYSIDSVNQIVTYPTVVSGLSPIATGWKILLKRESTIDQDVELDRQGPYDSETIEAEFDKLTMICQELEETLSRTPRFPDDEEITDDSTTAYLQACQAAQAAAEAAAEEIIGQYEATVLNNQSSAVDLTDVIFDGTLFRTIYLDYQIYRKTSMEEKLESGTFTMNYKTIAALWAGSSIKEGDSGAVLSIDPLSGQVQYTSDNMSGANYVGTFRYRIRTISVED